MISGDRVSKVDEYVSVGHVIDWRQLFGDALEEWWVVDISRFLIPSVEFTRWGFKFLPHLRSVKDGVVVFREHLWFDDSVGNLLDLFSSWPDILQEDILSI